MRGEILKANEKRILYVVEADTANPRSVGIFKKVYYQCKVFQDFGYCVDIYCLNNLKPQLISDPKKIIKKSKKSNTLKSKTFFSVRLLSKIYYWIKLFKILKILNYGVIYMRLPIPNVLTILTLNAFQGTKIIEIPTSPFANEIKNLGPLKRSLLLITRKIFLKPMLDSADLIVQIADKDIKNITQTKVIKIENGIAVDKIKPKKELNLPDEVINIVGVANVSFWHGFDRVIMGLADYYKRKQNVKVFFHIVGEGAELEKLIDLTKKLDLTEYVIFHGVKTGNELDKIYDMAHVGIGHLGLHRINLTSAAGLKEREYCSRGLPFLIAYEDEDFPDGLPFVLKVPPNDSPVSIEDIVKFVKILYGNYFSISRKMRMYAKNRISWHAKMKVIVDNL